MQAGGVDLARLRAGRLERLQQAMRGRGVEACLFFNPANVRYASGATTMTVYCLGSFVRCVLVPAEGRPILFDHGNSVHLFDGAIEADVRPMHAWEFYDDPATEAAVWARETVAAMRELGIPKGASLAIDKLAPDAFAALAAEGVRVTDSATITLDARSVKTPEEIALFRVNGRLAMDMLATFEAVVRPGVREQDLVAVLTDTMIRGGGEYLITRGVASGPNTNPWRQEATARAIAEGELVFVDTDLVGIEGYFYCVSRTVLCGETEPTPAQRALYRDVHDWLAATRDALRPGMTFAEFGAAAPAFPGKYMAQKYECVLHSCGLEDEGPSAVHPGDPEPNGDRMIEPNMVVVVEAYAGETGGAQGVKLGDELLITEHGVEVLAPYRFSETLLG
jgi:Xaa-Pro aminopeptidase